MELNAEIYKGGRVTIPVQIRNELGITEGDKVTFQLEDNELKILTLQQKLNRARALLQQSGAWDQISTDDFLAWKRAEAQREEAEMTRWEKSDPVS